MNDSTTGLNGRIRHHWSGLDRDKDIAALTDKAATAIPGLCSNGSSLFQVVGGKRFHLNPALLKDLFAKHVCAVRVVCRDGVWSEECYAYEFLHRPRFNPTHERPDPPKDAEWEPDQQVLDQLFRSGLLTKVPRIVGSE